MWEFIDKVVYINLDHRQDRRDIMKKFFEEGQIPEDKIIRISAVKQGKGIGCLKSHTQALQLAKNNNWKNVLILEDDLEWLEFDKGYSQLQEIMKFPRWDVIQLVGWYVRHDLPRLFYTLNAGAYIVNSSYYDTLLKNRYEALNKITGFQSFFLNCSMYTADVYWNKLVEKDYWYGLYPCICRQVDIYSDNLKMTYSQSSVNGIYKEEDKAKFFSPI